MAALLTSKLLYGKADLTLILNGALAGLVSITAGPDTPGPLLATLIGAIGGVLVVFSILGLERLRIDDPVGAISVHGTCGIWGVRAVLLSNDEASLGLQLAGLAVIFAWTFGIALVGWLVLKAAVGIRVTEADEYEGVDAAECGMQAYPEFVASQSGGSGGGGAGHSPAAAHAARVQSA